MKISPKVIIAAVVLLPSPSFAEDLNEIFKKLNTYIAEQNYPKALEELGWAKKELEKLNSVKIGALLPKEVNGFTGGEPSVQSALGFNNIERNYTSGSKSIKVSITGGGADSGLGGLAGLARMGMMMGGQQPGVDSFRLDGRTANLDTSSGSPSLTIFLDSGAILKAEGSSDIDGTTLRSFAEGLKISALDNYLRGTK
jgi:hypothetical protein